MESSMTFDQIRVRVVEFSDRKNYQLQWTCPVTGRKKTKSATPKSALRWAARMGNAVKHFRQLHDGRDV
jgi:hypothetical protein